MHLSLGLDETTLATFCQAHHICKLSLIGSQLKGTARVDSDVDLLVEFEPSHIPNLFELTRMDAEISEQLDINPCLQRDKQCGAKPSGP
jgi:predicted nucleotidyltransferase